MSNYPYDRTSDPRGYANGSSTPAGIDLVFQQAGSPLSGWGDAIHHWCRVWDYNPDLCAGQIHDETGGGISAIAVDKNNPGGYGAENTDATGTAYEKAVTFTTLNEGIRAVVAHECSHVYGDGPWTQYDLRASKISRTIYGKLRHLYEYEQQWAWSPQAQYDAAPINQRYGAVIAQRANLIVEKGKAAVSVDISKFVPPKIVSQPFPVNGISYLGEDMQMWGCAVHETGNTASGAEAQQNVNYMATQECIQRQASWHSTVGLDTIIESISQAKQAYHASDGSGPGNTHFKAIEGVMCYPVGTPEFQRVMMNHAWYVAKSLRDAKLPLVAVDANADWTSGKTLAQHNDFARDHKDCPQFYRDSNLWGLFCAYAQAFYDRNEWRTTPQPVPVKPEDNPLYQAATGHYVDPKFWDYWQQHGGLEDNGWAVTGSNIEDGLLVQYFERKVLELHPEGVMTRRLGAAAAAAAGFSGPGIP